MENSPIQDSTIENSDIKDTNVSDTNVSDTNNSDTKNSNPNDSTSMPGRSKGPNASALVLGLVALAMAALIIVMETTDVRVDWSQVGPGAITGVGVLLVVLGAVGLVRRRGND